MAMNGHDFFNCERKNEQHTDNKLKYSQINKNEFTGNLPNFYPL